MAGKTEKRIYKKNLFFVTKPSAMGILSICIGALAVLLIIAGFVISYMEGGHAGKIVGSLALTALIISGFGVIFAFMGFREEDKNYLPCKIGVILNGCVFVFLIFLFITGI